MRAVPRRKMVHPSSMASLEPVHRMTNPDRGKTTPWVIPHTDWTTMKSLYFRSGWPFSLGKKKTIRIICWPATNLAPSADCDWDGGRLAETEV